MTAATTAMTGRATAMTGRATAETGMTAAAAGSSAGDAGATNSAPGPLWTATGALAATHGRRGDDDGEDWSVTGVCIDSRTVLPGDLFIALVGDTFDGHDFVGAALAGGAVAAMVARVPEGVPPARCLIVPDTMEGLYALARAARARAAARIIAVTGSVGKTGTKEMLRLALSRHGLTHASQGNLNNHWGMPLSLARLPAEAAFCVLEMGMSHAGELAPLSVLARPHVAVVTAIEAAHLEFFSGAAAIADAKAEIFTGMDDEGIAVINRDTPYFDRLARAALERGVTTIYGFGDHIDSEFRLLDCTVDGAMTVVEADVLEQTVAYRIGVPGRHWGVNSLAVLAAVSAVGGWIGVAADSLIDMRPPKGRGARHPVRWIDPATGNAGIVEVIDESYNASPASVAAALAVLAAARPEAGGRRIVALGDMLELGPASDALHAGLADAVLANGIDLVFTSGPHMAHLSAALPAERRGGHAADAATLAPQVVAAVRPGDVVMIKGSAGSRTGTIVAALLAQAAGTGIETDTPAPDAGRME